MAKKVYSSIVLCMRKVLVRSVLVLCINVVIATKKVTEKLKKMGKIVVLGTFSNFAAERVASTSSRLRLTFDY